MDNRLLLIGSALMIAVFLVVGNPLSVIGDGHEGIEFNDCRVTSEADISSCDLRDGDMDGLGDSFDRESTGFWVEVDDVQPTGDSHAPQAYWLYKNGYVKESEEGDSFSNLHLSHGDFVWNGDVRESLKSASTVSLSMDIASFRGVNIETDKAAQSYNDEPECFGDYCGDITNDYYFNEEGERHSRNIMQREVTKNADEIRFTDNKMYAKFELKEYFDEGLELPGQFESWSGDNGGVPTIDEVGASGDVSVDFEVDSDGDGVMDSRDAYPNNPDHSTVRDSDGDGVENIDDVAPNEAGSKVDGSPTLLESFVHGIGFSGWLQPEVIPRF